MTPTACLSRIFDRLEEGDVEEACVLCDDLLRQFERGEATYSPELDESDLQVIRELRRVLKDDSYNGWSNRATWNVNLWVENRESLYRDKLEWLSKLAEPPTALDVSEFVQEAFGRRTPDGDHISKANFQELADSWEKDWQDAKRD